jgi:hypothetical protein
MRNNVNALIVWSSASHPFNSSYTNDYGTIPASGPAAGEATGDLSSGIPDVNVVAATLVTQFRAYSVALSRIRKIRLIRYYISDGPTYTPDFDQTQVTSTGQTRFQADMSAISPGTIVVNDVISAAAVDTFVSNLSTAIATNRNSTLTYNEYYCHTSCHSSCHGSI